MSLAQRVAWPFEPQAAVRLWVLPRLLLLLLAADVWSRALRGTLEVGRAGFNVAQIAALQWLAAPVTTDHYAGLLVATGFVAVFAAIRGPTRAALVLCAALYSSTWLLTRVDSYQHHYFLSLILGCVAAFPLVGRAAVLEDPPPIASAWAFRLVAVTVAVMYGFAAIAKMEPLWLGGAAVRAVVGSAPTLEPWIASLPPGHPLFVAMGAGVIGVELWLAVAYLASLGDARARASVAAFAAAAALHGSIALLQMRIGFFVEYMLVLAACVLLPARALARAARPFARLGSRVGCALERVDARFAYDAGPAARGLFALGLVVAAWALGQLARFELPAAEVLPLCVALAALAASTDPRSPLLGARNLAAAALATLGFGAGIGVSDVELQPYLMLSDLFGG